MLLPASLLYTAIVRLRRGSTRTPPPEEPKPPRRSRMHSGWADLADDPVPPMLRAASAAVLRAVGVGAAVPPPTVTPESPRKFTLGSVRVAPLVGVPMQRRRQTFAVFSFLIQPLSAPVTFLGVIILAHRAGYGLYVGALAASYIGWIWFGDSAPSKMPRTLPWLRRSIYFKWARDFFPAQLGEDGGARRRRAVRLLTPRTHASTTALTTTTRTAGTSSATTRTASCRWAPSSPSALTRATSTRPTPAST